MRKFDKFLKGKRKCEHCGGTGYHGKRKCPVCKGTGYVKRSITVKRKGIPKVVDSTTILNPEAWKEYY